jgi:CBS domain-containing protein
MRPGGFQINGIRVMSLKKIALTPPPLCAPGDTVAKAVAEMLSARSGAVIVVDGGKIAGMFTERDVLSRVVGEHRDPDATLLQDVMTQPVLTVTDTLPVEKALLRMLEHHFRHLPLVDEEGQPIGILSIRRIFEHHVRDLKQINSSLVAYLGADGPGG